MNQENNLSADKQNPFKGKFPKVSITIRLDMETIEYFKELAEKKSIPYQSLINLYLADCAKNKKDMTISWN